MEEVRARRGGGEKRQKYYADIGFLMTA